MMELGIVAMIHDVRVRAVLIQIVLAHMFFSSYKKDFDHLHLPIASINQSSEKLRMQAIVRYILPINQLCQN